MRVDGIVPCMVLFYISSAIVGSLWAHPVSASAKVAAYSTLLSQTFVMCWKIVLPCVIHLAHMRSEFGQALHMLFDSPPRRVLRSAQVPSRPILTTSQNKCVCV